MTDKGHKMKVVTIRMPPELYKRLAERAERERRSLNSEALVLLDTAMQEKKPRDEGQAQP